MSVKEFINKLNEIQASFTTYLPLIIVNSDYKINKGIYIFGKRGWMKINDPVPMFINYGALILLDTPKDYKVEIYRSANNERKIKPSSPPKAQKGLNNPSKIKTNDEKVSDTNRDTRYTSSPNTNGNDKNSSSRDDNNKSGA